MAYRYEKESSTLISIAYDKVQEQQLHILICSSFRYLVKKLQKTNATM
jgi:hypothetical protein